MKDRVLIAGHIGLAGAALAAVAASSKRAMESATEKVKAAKRILNPKAKVWPKNHPHVNPHYRERHGGLVHFIVGRGNKHFKQITMQDVGRWMPHNGAREMARRVRQMERANGTA